MGKAKSNGGLGFRDLESFNLALLAEQGLDLNTIVSDIIDPKKLECPFDSEVVLKHFPDLVSEILNTFQSPAYDGPLGRTALHAATFSNDAGMTENILERYGRDLCKQTDQKGWTPLHLAAYLGCVEPTKLLLQYGREVAYMKDAEGRTALHIAAHRNQEGVTKEIISMCPDCCEVVDNEGRNALHLAVHSRWPTAALIIQNNPSLRNLLNQADNDGNTPLHHYYNSVGYIKGVLNSPRVDEMVFNKKNQTAFQILRSKRFPTDGDEVQYSALQRKQDEFYKGQKNHWFLFNGRVLETGYDEIEKEKQPEGDEDWQEMEKKKEEMDKAAQVHLVVAALITTVTFAAGITMPGGFIGGDDHPHPGSAVLEKSTAFKAFIITNALALMLSSSAVFIYLFIPFIPSKSFFRQRLCFAQMAFWFLISSMAPMVLAFVTGTYAVLEHSNIAIPTCIICLSFITILVF
ncbi:hypothetical protein F2P56_037086, partial [Juglans regia]